MGGKKKGSKGGKKTNTSTAKAKPASQNQPGRLKKTNFMIIF
jgi:hypothetical protein